jgi:hypothetical protein
VYEISSKSISESSFRLSTKNAWARYVRTRWPVNGLAEMQRAWNLTEGQARGVLYAQASQSTIDAIMDHVGPMAAFGLGVEILAIKTGVRLEAFIDKQAQEARHEAAKWDAEERRLATISARLSERRAFSRGGAE